MNNNFNPDPAVLNNLLAAASKKLGCTPEQLRRGIESGDLSKSVSSQSKNDPQFAELSRLMNDPAAMKKLMSDPKAAALLKKLSGK